ncbi:MAG: hypothetical protein DSZ05_00185 [Sulfurospirillum sp.]|nr:MAG: hypothetical protein DSZ05_00185 [Sulfurospirillum sp.]
MQDIMITLVFMMAILMFSVYPAIKIVAFIAGRKRLSQKAENYLTFFFTVLIALVAAIFLKIT